MSGEGLNGAPEPGPEPSPKPSFLAELRRRQVFQSAAAYAAVAWGATEVLDGVISRFGWPDWWATLVVILFVVGFPVAMFLAWVFDWTPQGIRKEEPRSAMGWVSLLAAGTFLVAGSAGLFWLINPGGVAHVERTGVLVLPCRYRGEEQYAFRGDGLGGVLSDMLGHHAELRLPPYQWVLAWAEQGMSTADWGAQTGAALLVECRIAQQEEAWRVDVGVVDVENDVSEPLISLEADAADWVAVLPSLLNAVEIRLGVPAGEQSRALWQRRYPSVYPAFDALLKGEQALRQGDAEGYRAARSLFQEALVAGGPELPRLREADAFMRQLELEPPEGGRALSASLRAVDLMLETAERKLPDLAELLTAQMRFDRLARVLGQAAAPDLALQRQRFERALEIRPNYPEACWLMAELLREAGRESEAVKLLEDAGLAALGPQ